MSKKSNNKPTNRLYQIVMAVIAFMMILSMIALAIRY